MDLIKWLRKEWNVRTFRYVWDANKGRDIREYKHPNRIGMFITLVMIIIALTGSGFLLGSLGVIIPLLVMFSLVTLYQIVDALLSEKPQKED